MLFEWRNDDDTIEACLTGRGVSREEHREWFDDHIGMPFRDLLIYIEESMPMGVVRVDWLGDDDECEVHWTVAPEHRGCGLGTEMLEELVEWLPPGTVATARVKTDNHASQAVAHNAGFEAEEVVMRVKKAPCK
jgi:RimJ/RimL family protein N-acetyltransferase